MTNPTHGKQQRTFFHGYNKQYQSLPRAITCAENDLVVMVCLLFGSAHASLGAARDIDYLVGRLREAWPDVSIHVRADTGSAIPEFYATCEQLNLYDSVGFTMNGRMEKISEPLQKQALQQYEARGEPQRLFGDLLIPRQELAGPTRGDFQGGSPLLRDEPSLPTGPGRSYHWLLLTTTMPIEEKAKTATRN